MPTSPTSAAERSQQRKAENIKAHHEGEIRRLELEIERHRAIVEVQDTILSDGVEAGHDLNAAFARGETNFTADNNVVAPVHRGVDKDGHPFDPEGDAARTEDRAGISTNASERDINEGDGNTLADRRGVELDEDGNVDKGNAPAASDDSDDQLGDTGVSNSDVAAFSTDPADPDADDGSGKAEVTDQSTSGDSGPSVTTSDDSSKTSKSTSRAKK